MSPRTTSGPPKKRPYNSSRRALQAAQTRAAVLAAAVELFGEKGWGGTTLAAIAERAEVAVETVYAGFKSKKGLLRAAMDTAVVGDAEEIPWAERAEFHSLGEGDYEQRLANMAKVVTDIHERSIAVFRAILEAAAGDPEIDSWRIEMERGRRVDVERGFQRITGRKPLPITIDALWVLLGPEAYLRTTRDLGMSRREYERWLIASVRRFDDDPPSPRRP